MFSYIGALLTALSFAIAQQSSVPSDLSTNFDPSSITLQVLYSDASKTDLHGVGDGTTISQKEVTQTPSFSFGDASEVNFSLVTMILLVDTTTANRQLHFLQTSFTSTQDATAITSTDKPLVPYAAPGTLGEPSGTRKYSWLLFQQTGDLKTASSLKAGNFDVQKFISDNGLQDAIAGIEMVVPVQAQGGSNGGAAASSSSSAPPATTKAQTSTIQTSSQPTTQNQQTSTIPVITIPAATGSSSSTLSVSTRSKSQNTAAAAATSSSVPVTTISLSTSTPPPVTRTSVVTASSASSATPSISTAAAPRLAADQQAFFGVGGFAFIVMLLSHVLVSGATGLAVFGVFA